MKGDNNKRLTKKVKADMSADTSPLEPLNQRQAEYIAAIYSHNIILCIGKLGTAKTYIPAVISATMLRSKAVERIIIARPTEGKGKSVGFFKGTKEEKLEGWCSPVTDTLKKCLGLGNYEAYIENGHIELLALEQVKGRSWDDAFIIVDEAEDLDPAVAKSLVTRIGERSKMVITGDIAQQDLLQYSGLQLLLDVARHSHMDIAMIDFDSWDHCVRSEEAKAWGMSFEAYENRKK